MAISRRTMAFSALIASVGGGAWARGQSLPVSNPREILASDPAAFIQLLDDFRPSPVTSETKQMVLKSLPRERKGRDVNARGRAKLEGLSLVLRAVQRDAVYETRVFQSPWATIALDGRAVLLISERALEALDADQLRAAVAHEAAHEYVWEEWQRADKRDDWKRLRELELVCDGIAVVILQQLGLETSSLIRGFEKLTYLNLLWFGSPPNPSRYPTLAERSDFARKVAAWMTGLSRKDASGFAIVARMSEEYGNKINELINRSEITDVLNGYFRAIDQKDFDPQHFAAILTADAKMTRPNGMSLTGPEEISASHAQSFTRFESSQHLLTAPDISIDGGTATVRANLVAMHMWEGSKTNANNVDNFFVAGGVIDATLMQVDGRWKISQLSNTVIWRAGGFRNMLQTR